MPVGVTVASTTAAWYARPFGSRPSVSACRNVRNAGRDDGMVTAVARVSRPSSASPVSRVTIAYVPLFAQADVMTQG